MKLLSPILATLLAMSALGSIAQAEVRLPSVFTNHMVLQRGMPVPVWGWAEPGEEVAVVFGDQTKETKADDDGRWQVTLDPLSVGEPRSLAIEGTNRVEVVDVLVGEVWICSGQSNMQFALRQTDGGDLELASADVPEIRLLTVAMVGMQELADDFDGAWETCTPDTAANFSGVGYFFGRRLHQTLGVPIGLIDNAWGGSSCETWVPREKLSGKPLYEAMLENWDKQAAEADETAIRAEFQKRHDQWKGTMQAAVAAGKPIPGWPRPRHRLLAQGRPSNLYNSRVAPLMPFAIRGAIWYQGESNAGRAAEYRDLFPLMIETWREEWKQGDFPFYWVQLADFKAEQTTPAPGGWAELREAQTMALDRLPNSGEAVIIDIGEGKDIHPKNKRTVADRLARHALANEYGVQINCDSPRFESLEVKEGSAIVTLRDCATGLRPFDTKKIRGFAIAGEDGKWVWGDAKIVGKNQIEVSSAEVSQPVAVRYAWADNPVCNLYSNSGLPVTPFRSDAPE